MKNKQEGMNSLFFILGSERKTKELVCKIGQRFSLKKEKCHTCAIFLVLLLQVVLLTYHYHHGAKNPHKQQQKYNTQQTVSKKKGGCSNCHYPCEEIKRR